MRSILILSAALALAAAHGVLAGCSVEGNTIPRSASSSDSEGDGNPSKASCPPLPEFTGATCGSEQIGPSCPGTVACQCGAMSVEVATSCVCGNNPAIQGDTIWTCQDDCSNACDPDAGGAPDASPDSASPKPCETFCLHQSEAGCTDAMSIGDCEAKICVPFPEPSCQPAWDAMVQCYAAADLTCDANNHTTASGCKTEADAVGACL